MKNLIKGMSHVAYNVTDLDRALDFYCNKLGLEKAFEIVIPESLKDEMPDLPMAQLSGKAAIVYIKAGQGVFLELFHPLPGADLSNGGPRYFEMGYVHLSLVVDDIKEAVAVLESRGVTMDTEISFGPDHTYQVWIKDPDGNRIELMEYTDKSLQVTCLP